MSGIVPIFIYYHAATIVKSMKFETQDLTRANDVPSESKEAIIYSVWSRLENLLVVKILADQLFGVIIITVPVMGCSFSTFAVFFYSFINVIKNASTIDSDELPVHFTSLFFYPSRLVFSVSFMSKLLFNRLCNLFLVG